MNSERVFNIILSDLALDKIKFEEDLERVINSDIEIEVKLDKVKTLLNKISMAELSIAKFNSMLPKNNNNNN